MLKPCDSATEAGLGVVGEVIEGRVGVVGLTVVDAVVPEKEHNSESESVVKMSVITKLSLRFTPVWVVCSDVLTMCDLVCTL